MRLGLLVMGAVAATAVTTVVGQADRPLTEREGERLARKLTIITHNASEPSGTTNPVVIYQREVNAYLRFQAAPEIPTGIAEPAVRLHEAGTISAHAVVELSDIGADRPRELFDPLRYLRGRVPVTARGRLHTTQGVGRVEVESVTFGGVAVPVSALEELVRFYSRSPEQPRGIDLREPFALPFGVDELHVEDGRATVIQ